MLTFKRDFKGVKHEVVIVEILCSEEGNVKN